MEDKTLTYGKYWAAIKDGKVVNYLSMRPSNDIDFEEFRSQAIRTLELLGEVKSGEIISRGGKRLFLQRLPHTNRGKSPRAPREYPLPAPIVLE